MASKDRPPSHPAKVARLEALADEVRLCFHRLRSLAERLHADLGVAPSMRGVMEALAGSPGRSVPEIAAARGVSRQHIQTVMNDLQERDLVRARSNPAHRRSPLFVLTSDGAATFAELRRREAVHLERFAAALPAAAIEGARDTLAALNREFDTLQPEGVVRHVDA